MIHEKEITEAFIIPSKQERYVSLIGSKKGRKKFLERLAHEISGELDPRFAHRIDGTAQRIEKSLARLGAPSICYVVSENDELDEKEMNLHQALEETVGCGMGTFISCVLGKLAYFEGEDRRERYLLNRQ